MALAVCTVLSAFAASLLELSVDVAEGKLLHKTFILSEADFYLTSQRKGQPRKKISEKDLSPDLLAKLTSAQ